MADSVLTSPDIKTELDAAGDNISRASRYVQLANSAHQRVHVLAALFHKQQRFGGGNSGVTAQSHRHCTRMTGLTTDFDLKTGRAGNGCDNADRQVFAEQYRALLDMGFHIRQHIVRVMRGHTDSARIKTIIAQGCTH